MTYTREQLERMSDDRLDYVVARVVFNWPRLEVNTGSGWRPAEGIPHYTTDGGAAWDVIHRMRHHPDVQGHFWYWSYIDGRYGPWVTFTCAPGWSSVGERLEPMKVGDTPFRAIAIQAILAVQAKEGTTHD